MRWMLVVLGLGVAWVARAGELTPEKAAEIRRDQKKALAEVAKRHGGKKPTEMSPAERREVVREEQEAVRQVLEKHGVSAKEHAWYEATAGRDEREAMKRAGAALDEKEAAEKKKVENPDADAPEVVVEVGTGEDEAAQEKPSARSKGAKRGSRHR